MDWTQSIRIAIDEMEKHLLEEDCVEKACRAALVSPMYLQQGFRIMTGLSALDPYSGQSVPLERGIDPKQLTVNKQYDVAALGQDYGYLVLSLWVTPEELTLEMAADYLLAVKSAMEEAGVGFAGVELFLTVMESDDPWQSLALNMLTYEDLEAENLSDYLKQFVVKS